MNATQPVTLMKHLWQEDRPDETYCDLCGIRAWQAVRQPNCPGGADRPVVRP